MLSSTQKLSSVRALGYVDVTGTQQWEECGHGMQGSTNSFFTREIQNNSLYYLALQLSLSHFPIPTPGTLTFQFHPL